MTVDIGLADSAAIGQNLQATVAELEKRMKEAAGNLDSEAARLRDEIERLQSVALAVGDDPLARQEEVEAVAGAFAGERGFAAAPPTCRPPARASPPTPTWARTTGAAARRARRAGEGDGGGGGE